MKPYINFNTRKRKEATNEADKNHFKLLNKAVYGKTIENMRKRIKIIVVKNAKDFIKYTSRPTCVNWKVFENNLAAIHEKKIPLTLNKPIYVGFAVWEWEPRLPYHMPTSSWAVTKKPSRKPSSGQSFSGRDS